MSGPRGAEDLWSRAGAAMAVVFFALTLLLALPAAPLTDDDDFYIPAGQDYAAWLGRVARLDLSAFRRSAIDDAFDANHEHPPVAKYALGLSGALLSGALGPVSGPRAGTVFFAVLAAAAMMWMARMQLGPRRGTLLGALSIGCLLLLPRFFFHARVATLDVPVAGMYTLTAALALRAERRSWAAWVLGPVFGLATATKLNAPFFVVPYLAYALLVRGGTARAARAASPGAEPSRRGFQLPSLPLGLLSMAVLGPLTFFASWPWMWFDVIERVQKYVSFHLGHYGIYFLYFGRLYDKDPYAPWHMPLVMAAITIPLAISVLAMVGLAAGLPRMGARIYAGHAAWAAQGDEQARLREGELALFVGLNAAATICTVALSGGAKYGGAKLFMPFFPFWCLLAGYGGLRLGEAAWSRGPRARGLAGVALALVIASGLGQHLRFAETPLSQYNALAGGLRGATALGFERQYYDLAFRDLVQVLNDKAPPNTRIHFLPNNWEYVRTFKWYRREGSLRSDLQVVQAEGVSDWVVLTHERRFRRYGEDLRRARSWTVIEERRVDGVPLWTILSRRAPAGAAAPPGLRPEAS
ncbi:MAG: glycosyltransferase family 39 protein [Myxococcota bacterium]